MKDEIVPGGKWEFDEGVTEVFDDMLERSIPQYDVMRAAVADLASKYLMGRPGEVVIDLGTSLGGAIDFLSKAFPSSEFVGVECSGPMLSEVRKRFFDRANVRIEEFDLRKGLPPTRPASVVLSVFTLQFVPIEYRQMLVSRIRNRLVKRGCFVMVEKVLGANAEIDSVMVETYLDMKRWHGYTEEQVRRKKMSLEGVLVPVTAKWNEELLKMAGFRTYDCFWRWMNFAGWIAEK